MYDGDGRRVKSIIGGETTLFVGAHYEVTNGVVTKYYFAGAQRIAMRKNGTLSYILTGHLGSTSMITNASGAMISEMKYKAWGEVRFASGTTPTKYTYTGQYSNVSAFGLMFYNARWYDPLSGRFSQADTVVPGENARSSSTVDDVAKTQYVPLTTGYYAVSIIRKLNRDNQYIASKGGLINLTKEDRKNAQIAGVPLNVQQFDRFAYGLNNPLRYVDPTGYDGNPYKIFA